MSFAQSRARALRLTEACRHRPSAPPLPPIHPHTIHMHSMGFAELLHHLWCAKTVRLNRGLAVCQLDRVAASRIAPNIFAPSLAPSSPAPSTVRNHSRKPDAPAPISAPPSSPSDQPQKLRTLSWASCHPTINPSVHRCGSTRQLATVIRRPRDPILSHRLSMYRTRGHVRSFTSIFLVDPRL